MAAGLPASSQDVPNGLCKARNKTWGRRVPVRIETQRVERRFVLLRHQMPDGDRDSHWDLMIENNGALATWALVDLPCAAPSQSVERLADHRLAYLTYEGPISSNRGVVTRWDEGACKLLEQSDSRWSVIVHGKRIQGSLTLSRDPDRSWAMRFVGASPLSFPPIADSVGSESDESGESDS